VVFGNGRGKGWSRKEDDVGREGNKDREGKEGDQSRALF
jgi:hypothetical protein